MNIIVRKIRVLASILLLLSCFISCASKTACADESQTILLESKQHDLQPIPVQTRDTNMDTDLRYWVDEQGGVSTDLYDCIDPSVTNGMEIVLADDSPLRLLLLTVSPDGMGKKVLAVTYGEDHAFHVVESPTLPSVSGLDTFHDGDSIFLYVPDAEAGSYAEAEDQSDWRDLTDEEDYLDDLAWWYITFELLDDKWVLISITDGNDISLDRKEDGYELYGFIEEDETESIQSAHELADIYLDEFNLDEIMKYLDDKMPRKMV